VNTVLADRDDYDCLFLVVERQHRRLLGYLSYMVHTRVLGVGGAVLLFQVVDTYKASFSI